MFYRASRILQRDSKDHFKWDTIIGHRVPEERALDIDTLFDLHLARLLMADLQAKRRGGGKADSFSCREIIQ